MLKIGLTGGIGSGKSTVAAIFKVMGVPIFNADYEAKRLMQTDSNLVISIKNLLGEESYVDNELNRSFIATLIFNNSAKLDALNSLVHPVVTKAATEWMTKQKSAFAIKEAALLFEAGSAEHLDYVIGVSAPEHLRIKRVMLRDKITREQVLERINRQIDDRIKMKLCDYTIVNDEHTSLIDQVHNLFRGFNSLSQTTL